MRWDPDQYLRFADDRGRPFQDLIAQVAADDPAVIVDLGCGPGNLTRTLAARWPRARVEGLDASPEMIRRAQVRPDGQPGEAWTDTADVRADRGTVAFRLGDLRDWTPEAPVDVIISNATLQWVPEHLDLLDRLARWLRPAGWLAFQVPANFRAPAHTELADVLDSPRSRDRPAPGVDRAVGRRGSGVGGRVRQAAAARLSAAGVRHRAPVPAHLRRGPTTRTTGLRPPAAPPPPNLHGSCRRLRIGG